MPYSTADKVRTIKLPIVAMTGEANVYVDTNAYWGDSRYEVSNNVTKYEVYDEMLVNSAKVRAYKKVNGKYYYSAWSNSKSAFSGIKIPS